MTILESQSGLTALNERLSGVVLAPDGFGWDDARQAYNLTIDQQPAAVAFPDDARDVQAVVDYAAAPGSRSHPSAPGTTPHRSDRCRTRSCSRQTARHGGDRRRRA